MMLKFKLNRKGRITQLFNKNENPLYQEAGLSGHTGVDWTLGYGRRITTDNGGYVYKTLDRDKGTQGASGFTGVYILKHLYKEYYAEILIGHLSEIFVNEGDHIPEDTCVGKEGNCGDVYYNGVYYPEGSPNKGEKGSHVHEQFRLVKRVKEHPPTAYYLERNGIVYEDQAGYAYEIMNRNNVLGCVDPMLYVHKDTVADMMANMKALLDYYKSK